MISVIVIGKNEGERLQRCLTSVKQVFADECPVEYEIIYVDSQSTDDSVSFAQTLPVTHVVLLTGVCNAAIARNAGAEMAKGDILFFLDGDMKLLPGFLPKILTGQSTLVYPFLSALFSDEVHDTQWNYLFTTYRHKQHVGDSDTYEAVTGGFFLIMRELWEKVGGMDTRFRCNEDYDLGLRLTQMGLPLCRKSILAVKHYMVNYTLRASYVTNMKYAALLLRKHWRKRNCFSLFCKSRYTTLCLFWVLFVVWWFWPVVLLWIVALLYKTLHNQSSSVSLFFRLAACDFYFIGALLCYWPKQRGITYEILK